MVVFSKYVCVWGNNKSSSVMTTFSYVMWEEKSIPLSFFFSFLKQACCWVWSGVIVWKNVWVYDLSADCCVLVCERMCVCVCAFLWLRTHVSWVCCKVMSVSLQTTAVMWHWALTDSLSCCSVPTDPYWVCVFFFREQYPLMNTTLLLNLDGLAPPLSLYLSSFISFSFSESVLQTPLPPLLPLSMRPLCSAFQS